MEAQTYRKSRKSLFIKHGIAAAIAISIYFFFDYGLMKLVLPIQLLIIIKDLRMKIIITDQVLIYHTLFSIHKIPVNAISRIYLAEKRTYGAYVPSTYYEFHLYIKEDGENKLYAKIPTTVIPKKERLQFAETFRKIDQSIYVELVTPQFTVG